MSQFQCTGALCQNMYDVVKTHSIVIFTIRIVRGWWSRPYVAYTCHNVSASTVLHILYTIEGCIEVCRNVHKDDYAQTAAE